MLLTSSWSIYLPPLFIIAFVLYKYFSRNYDYWEKKGVFYLKPIPFIGNLYDVISFKTTIAHWQQNVYNSTDEPFVGIFAFHKPVLTLRSPELIKQVLVKHFDHFINRTVLAPDHSELFANMLFASKNESWKLTRPKITAAFTSSKLKVIFPIIQDIANEMNDYLKKNKGELEVKDLASRYTTEVIARTVFGLNAHCFEKTESIFRKMGGLYFNFNWKTAIAQCAYFYMHSVANFFHLEFGDKAATDYLKNVLWSTIEQREKRNDKGNDLIDLVMELRKNNEFREQNKFEGDKVLAQPIQVFVAGVETTSQIIAFALYELCLQPQIQNKLRNEILDYLEKNEEVDYNSLKDLKYLEMCILETLRKYPTLPFLDRECNADFTIPGTDIVIDKGTLVYIPLLALHYDENYFPEPNKFNPDRFANGNIYNKNGLYFLPFGEGPRMCFGEMFAKMMTKIALVNILSQFVIEPSPATPIPLTFTKKYFTLKSEHGLPMICVEYNRVN